MSKDLLVTYITDHLAGAETAIALVERWRPHLKEKAPELSALFEELDRDMCADVETLDAVRLRIAPYSGAVKRTGGWLTEKLLRLRLTRANDVQERLALFESLEMLSLGIQGKRAMWTLLGELSARHHELAGPEYGVLELRAVDQFHQVEAARLALGRKLFTESYAEETP